MNVTIRIPAMKIKASVSVCAFHKHTYIPCDSKIAAQREEKMGDHLDFQLWENAKFSLLLTY